MMENKQNTILIKIYIFIYYPIYQTSLLYQVVLIQIDIYHTYYKIEGPKRGGGGRRSTPGRRRPRACVHAKYETNIYKYIQIYIDISDLLYTKYILIYKDIQIYIQIYGFIYSFILIISLHFCIKIIYILFISYINHV